MSMVPSKAASANPIARVGPEMDVGSMSKMFAESGFFKDSRSAAQAGVKILAGRELGVPPVAAMTGIYIVKDKVMVGATILASCVQRSGRFAYRVLQLDDKGCRLEFFENGQSVGISEFTVKEATAAGLSGSQTYRSYPRNMYFSRALSNGVKWYCPGVLSGPVYTPEELGVPVNAAGEPVVAEPGDEPSAKRSTLRAASLLEDDKPEQTEQLAVDVVDPPKPEIKPCPVPFTEATDWRDAMLTEMQDRGYGDKAACVKKFNKAIKDKGFESYLSMPADERRAAWERLVTAKPAKPETAGGGA